MLLYCGQGVKLFTSAFHSVVKQCAQLNITTNANHVLYKVEEYKDKRLGNVEKSRERRETLCDMSPNKIAKAILIFN